MGGRKSDALLVVMEAVDASARADVDPLTAALGGAIGEAWGVDVERTAFSAASAEACYR